jgi:Zn-finger nucleic acid-binding protein
MKCPACSRTLTTIKTPNITVEACQDGCGGLWFSPHQLQKVEFQDEKAGAELLNVRKNDSIKINLSAKRNCPTCNVIMMQHFFSPKRSVVVDECPKCAGFWLDAGELANIRSEYHSQAERDRASEAYFDDVFGTDVAKEREKIQKAAKLFSFIHPSSYLTTKK